MTGTTKNNEGDEAEKGAVVGRVIFWHDNNVIKAIDLGEDDLKVRNKIGIVNNGINELIKEGKIGKGEVNDVRIETEFFPPQTFLSSANSKYLRTSKSFKITVNEELSNENNTNMKVKFNVDINEMTSDLKDNEKGKITIKVLPNYNEELPSLSVSYSFDELRKTLFDNIDINKQNVRQRLSDLAQSVAGYRDYKEWKKRQIRQLIKKE